MFDKDLLDIMACPKCKARLEWRDPEPGDDVQGRLVCTACGLRYAVKDDLPNMIIDEALPPK